LKRLNGNNLYRAFGLNIESALELPELLPCEQGTEVVERSPDVTIRLDPIDSCAKPGKGNKRYIVPAPDGICLGWPDVGDFLVRGGREIVVDPAPGASEPLLRLFLLGTTMAMLLHQRGDVAVLHASAVSIDGQALAFVGAKGYGKSTMAASLLARGHELLSDDVLAVDVRAPTPIALAGFPHLKLWPDSLNCLGHDVVDLPRLRPELEKRGQRLSKGYSGAPAPLKGIFVLDRGDEPEIRTLRAWDALTAIIPHWYAARFGPDLVQALGMSSHFLQCAALTRSVPVSRLARPNDLNALPDVARMVEIWCEQAADCG
jgi:hypothetical protein